MAEPLLRIEKICPTCHGEGAVGTGYSTTFVDIDDAMLCPTCEGDGTVPVGQDKP